MKSKVVAWGLMLAGLAASAGFRETQLTWHDLRPNLAVLAQAKDSGGCGTGSTLTRSVTCHPYELKMTFERAKQSIAPELDRQGWTLSKSAVGLTTWRRTFEAGSLSLIVLRDRPGDGHCSLTFNTGLQRISWYGLPVPSPF